MSSLTPGRERTLNRAVSLQHFGRSTSFSPQLHEVKTRDIYGFEVDARRSASYRAFYEKFVATTQKQTGKASAIMDSGVLKTWNCAYARGRNAADIPEQVAALVRDGLPSIKRGEIWLQLTGVSAKVQLYQGVYESLLEPYEQAEQYGTNSSPATIQIEKDVPRTFPGYTYTPKGKQFQPALRKLLRAYAMRNPKLGYCQSMNFIAGGLLIFLDEVDAFWMLCFIVEELLPDYFTRNIIGPQIDAEVLNELIAEQLPELHEHFVAHTVNTVLISTQWFMCLFIRTLPFECAFRVWDALFLYGPQILFEVGLAILKMHQTEILTFEDTIDIVSHLNSSLADSFDCSRIWDIQITPIDHKRIASSRAVQKEKVLRDMRMKADILDLMDIIPSSKFTREDMEELYEQYANLNPKINDDSDVVETGLSKSVFQKVILRICQWQYEEYFMDRLFLYFDTHHNHVVDFKELIKGLAILIKGTNEEKLKMCFVLFDQNSDGFVDREELHTMLTTLYTLCNNPNPPPPTPPPRATQSHRHSIAVHAGGASSNALTQSGGVTPVPLAHRFSLGTFLGTDSSRKLSMSDGDVPPKLNLPPKLNIRQSGGGEQNTPTKLSSLRQSGGGEQNTPTKLKQNGAEQASFSPSTAPPDPTIPVIRQRQKGGTEQAASSSPSTAQRPDPAIPKTPSGEPPLEKIAEAPDYASEVSFFVDMLFKIADVTKDDLLSFEEFREAALLHPYILKTFNLDHQREYDVRISIG